MLTVFEILYDLAIELQSNPSLKSFTLHHSPDRATVEARLQDGILHTLMMDESITSKWGKTRIFCRNYVNRAQGVVTPKQMVSLLATVEKLHPSDDERLAALASTAAATFDVKRKNELVFALEKITSIEKLASLNHQSYLEWVENRWTYWINQKVDSMVIDELLNDLQVLYLNPITKIPGIGLPLAANFFADMGVTMFVKPDIHVTPIANMLTLSDGEIEAFKGLVKIAKSEREKLRKISKFHWLNEQGGLYPRHLDRLIYMIGSDNFLLNSQQSKRYAPNRRQLMRNALISGGLVSATYQAQGELMRAMR
jgi:hypothetical protein